ncbi:hypothetical protein RHDC4_02080 [Rhodocyclaceae bacterium]|nr:hypothetical protein RHDC4_02080 [Rhodocyclaceae bacterium]
MEELYNRTLYGPVMAVKVESLGATAVSIANRWVLGWPERVTAMVKEGTFLTRLTQQVETEKTVLSEAVGMSHLSNIEILQQHGVALEAPETAATV